MDRERRSRVCLLQLWKSLPAGGWEASGGRSAASRVCSAGCARRDARHRAPARYRPPGTTSRGRRRRRRNLISLAALLAPAPGAEHAGWHCWSTDHHGQPQEHLYRYAAGRIEVTARRGAGGEKQAGGDEGSAWVPEWAGSTQGFAQHMSRSSSAWPDKAAKPGTFRDFTERSRMR